MKNKQRIFFSVDVHGATAIWKKWLKIPSLHQVDILMLCGDLTGKLLVPIIKQGNGSYKAFYGGENKILQTEVEILKIEEKLAAEGAYTIHCDEPTINYLKGHPNEVESIIKKKAVGRVVEWLELLIDRVDTKKTRVIVMPGNDDDYCIDPAICSYADKGIEWCLDKIVNFEGIEMISLAHVNPTPWNTPREVTEKEINQMIENLMGKLKIPQKSIFNFHAPPHGTRIDLAPELNKDKKPVVKGGQLNFIHAGSKSIAEAIKRYQPMLGIHGHIHEAAGVEKIGNTICINPGSEYGEGILHGYIIEISTDKVENYWRVEG